MEFFAIKEVDAVYGSYKLRFSGKEYFISFLGVKAIRLCCSEIYGDMSPRKN